MEELFDNDNESRTRLFCTRKKLIAFKNGSSSLLVINPNGWFKFLITTHEICISGIFSGSYCNFHQQNDPIPASCWPLVVTSELGHRHLVAFIAPVFVESWLHVVYADVDGLLNTPLKPLWSPKCSFSQGLCDGPELNVNNNNNNNNNKFV